MEASASRELNLGGGMLVYAGNFNFGVIWQGKKKGRHRRGSAAFSGKTCYLTVISNGPTALGH